MDIIVVDVLALDDPADTMVGVSCFILAVLAGVLGLVLTGFTAWHISLVARNLTTIESLERTRYVMPLRDILDHKRKEILMAWNQGVLAPPVNIQKRNEAQEAARSRGQYDEWQKHSDNGRFSHTVNPYQRANYAPEHLHELERHYLYLDDSEADALPHAYDRGWRENFRLLFGENRVWWWLPTKNVYGDGWMWPINPEFAIARQTLEKKREQRIHDIVEGWRLFYWTQSPTGPSVPTSSRPGLITQAGAWPQPKNPYAIAAAKRAEEEMRIDMDMNANANVNVNVNMSTRMRYDGGDGDEDLEQGGGGLSLKTLDFDKSGVQRGN